MARAPGWGGGRVEGEGRVVKGREGRKRMREGGRRGGGLPRLSTFPERQLAMLGTT